MEKVGAVAIFERSVEKHGLFYTKFYGDGDSKSFTAVQNIYGSDKPVAKFECIGHFQKRVGNRLRKLKKEKKLGGTKRLTNSMIDILQNYFGIALRQNIGKLENMTNAIIASLYHVSDYHERWAKTYATWSCCVLRFGRVYNSSLITWTVLIRRDLAVCLCYCIMVIRSMELRRSVRVGIVRWENIYTRFLS